MSGLPKAVEEKISDSLNRAKLPTSVTRSARTIATIRSLMNDTAEWLLGKVCDGCGVERGEHEEHYYTPTITRWSGDPSDEPQLDKCGEWITNAEFLARQEER